MNAFLHTDRGLDCKPSWALGCCSQGVFWIWHVPGTWAAGAGVAGWGGSLHNESLCLSRNAVSQKQVWEGTGKMLRTQEPFPGCLSPGEREKGSVRTAQLGLYLQRQAGELDCVPSPNVIVFYQNLKSWKGHCQPSLQPWFPLARGFSKFSRWPSSHPRTLSLSSPHSF